MTSSANVSVPNLGSFLSLGALLIVAGVFSHGIYRLSGEWPVGSDGVVGTLFLVFGAILVVVSIAVQVRDRRAARQ